MGAQASSRILNPINVESERKIKKDLQLLKDIDYKNIHGTI